MDRKLVAILAADVVGYSTLMEQDEQGTFERLRAGRKELFEPEIARHHGRIFKLMGDGLLAEFGSVVDAVECAVSLQRGLSERNANVPENRCIQVRIGINLGEVIVEGDDYYGEGVNIATRLEQIAEPGGIYVSGKVAKEVEKKLAFGFEAMGEQKVKNIAEPVQVFRITLEGQTRRRPPMRSPPRWAQAGMAALVALLLIAGAAWQFWPTAPVSGKPSVAVLPFDNFSGDDATLRLANGLTEDIITDLARFPEFTVVARNSTVTYKGKAADPRVVGAALHVDYVVEGSIQRETNRVRITAQLIDTATGQHLWSNRWDRPDEDIFAVQTEIAEQVSNRLGGGAGLIQEAGRVAAHRKVPESLSAYELYLLGTEKLEQINRADVKEAIRLLSRAVEHEPGLARAWVELYHSHVVAADFGDEPESNKRLAADAAQHAVRLDPSDAEAHAVYAMSLGDRSDIERAKAEFDTALRLAPNQFEILAFYIAWAPTLGEPERGAKLVDQAIRVNPSYPLWSTRIFAHAYFMVGRYSDALRMIDRLAPENYDPWMWTYRSGALAALGNVEEAKVSVKAALKWFPDLTIEGHVNRHRNNDAERKRVIETMRLAGFPPCAKPEALAKIEKPLRLSECQSQP